jgi:hypothetical protein
MSYLPAEDPNITADINSRKEFSSYNVEKQSYRKYNDNIIPQYMLDDQLQRGNYLALHSYQLFVSNFMNPNTPYSRLLLKWETGIGKTIGALAIAINFINYYRKEQRESLDEVGTIFVIGFSERVFKNELLRYPELGFISRDEHDQMISLKKLASAGSTLEMEKLREFIMKIKKRFTNRIGYGFFKFIGYKAFVNRIFKMAPGCGLNFNDLTEVEIQKYIKEGQISVDAELLAKFRNGLIICDEIHNVYNSLDKNNWGVAIQYILDNSPTTRALFMSATPLNNSPTEIIDLLNLMLPKDTKMVKEDFFTSDRELKPGALDKIAACCQGRVSFLRDVNPKYFPRRTITGESLPDVKYLKFVRCPMSEFHYDTYKQVHTDALSQDSQYLVDFALPNPDPAGVGLYQTQTIKKALSYASQAWKTTNKIGYRDNKIIGSFMKRETIGKYSAKYAKMLDAVLDLVAKESGKLFIYHNVVHISGVLFIQELLIENGFLDEFGNSHDTTICVLCGKMRSSHAKDQLTSINGGSADPITVVDNDDVSSIYEAGQESPVFRFKERSGVLKADPGSFTYFGQNAEAKRDVFGHILDYFDRRLASDISRIEIRMRSRNGAVPEFINRGYSEIADPERHISKLVKLADRKGGAASASAPASSVSAPASASAPATAAPAAASSHMFQPARFIVVHSEIDKNMLYQSLDKFNNSSNAFGHNYMILVGSKIVKESHDFKAIRNVFIMGRPDNIPMLRQIIGRAIRKNSHIDLPVKSRTVDIKIFTTCLPVKDDKGVYKLSYEETKYKEKVHFYEIIQNIEKVFHENAIDSIINQDTIQIQVEDPLQSDPAKMIKHYDMLPYKPNAPAKLLNRTFKLNELNLSTFEVFHYKTEIKIIMGIIKRLFVELSTVWTYADLFKMVTFPPFITEMNPKLFDEDLYCMALSRLLWNRTKNYVEPHFEATPGTMIDKIVNPDDKFILVNGAKSVIVHLDSYYILFPLDPKNQPIIDMEHCYRTATKQEKRSINLHNFMDNIVSLFNYDEKKKKFYVKWKNVAIANLEPAINDFGLPFHVAFIEDCIQYVFDLFVNKKAKSPMHGFYLTMLYYYDARHLVVWASTAREIIAKMYAQYIQPISLKVLLKQSDDLGNIGSLVDNPLSTTGIVNLLKSTINNSRNNWVPSEIQAHFQASKNRFDEFYDKSPGFEKVPSDILPIGHIMANIPKFYHPDRGGWFESPEYLDTPIDYVENPLIIGYEEKVKNSSTIKFKVRPAVQNLKKSNDSRKIERGSVCNNSKSKGFLKDISAKLGITPESKLNVGKLCDRIRRRLIYNELAERMNPASRVKWFYFCYEKQPIIGI